MSTLDFNVRTAEVGANSFIVSLSGEADLHNAPQLDTALQGVLGLGGSAVAVDFADVSFVDSTALGVLLRYQPRFAARGGSLMVVSEDRRVLKTFEITGLDRIFTIERRLTDAVASMLATA